MRARVNVSQLGRSAAPATVRQHGYDRSRGVPMIAGATLSFGLASSFTLAQPMRWGR